jgi:hypothetical protein
MAHARMAHKEPARFCVSFRLHLIGFLFPWPARIVSGRGSCCPDTPDKRTPYRGGVLSVRLNVSRTISFCPGAVRFVRLILPTMRKPRKSLRFLLREVYRTPGQSLLAYCPAKRGLNGHMRIHATAKRTRTFVRLECGCRLAGWRRLRREHSARRIGRSRLKLEVF